MEDFLSVGRSVAASVTGLLIVWYEQAAILGTWTPGVIKGSFHEIATLLFVAVPMVSLYQALAGDFDTWASACSSLLKNLVSTARWLMVPQLVLVGAISLLGRDLINQNPDFVNSMTRSSTRYLLIVFFFSGVAHSMGVVLVVFANGMESR